MKYAIWTAVSTKAQATQDKVSLTEQETKCRAYAASLGWQESAGPFIADGYSRTGYTDLTDAIIDIPPLRELIEQLNQIDLLLMFSYDRMGDVLPMLAVKLKQHRKQILSISQPTPIQSPDQFDPYANEGAEIMQDVARITQRFRINDFRRKWNMGIPARVDRGLHPLSLPFGYALAGDGQPAVIVPENAELLKQMKDQFLSGESYADIARRADEIMPPPRGKNWSIQTVRRMLINPYYAGIVRFGKLRTVNGQRIPQPRKEWRLGDGKHTPLWDESTYRAIINEYNRRIDLHRNYNVRYPYSGLTYCGICGGKVSKHGSRYQYLACTKSSKHWHLNYDKAVDYITARLMLQLDNYQANPPRPEDTTLLETQLKEHAALRARVQAGYEAGLYNMAEAMGKLSAIDEAAEKIRQQLTDIEERQSAGSVWREKMQQLQEGENDLLTLIETRDPAEVNQLLSSLIEKITLYHDNTLKVTWRL